MVAILAGTRDKQTITTQHAVTAAQEGPTRAAAEGVSPDLHTRAAKPKRTSESRRTHDVRCVPHNSRQDTTARRRRTQVEAGAGTRKTRALYRRRTPAKGIMRFSKAEKGHPRLPCRQRRQYW